MAEKRKAVLVCDCEGTMDPAMLRGAADGARVHTHLCGAQIRAFRDAVAGDAPVLVACTQEAPLFTEVAAEIDNAAALSFVNIRENGGWSAEGAAAGPKIKALLAEAALDLTPTPMVHLESRGRTVVYGDGEEALSAARQLSGKLDVTCVLAAPGDVAPPAIRTVPIFAGRLRHAAGHLGAFSLIFDDWAAAAPRSRGELSFGAAEDGRAIECDVLIDLSGGARALAADRDGYFRADPRNPAQVQRVLFEATDLVGEFDKPRYVRVDATLCAHSRNRKTGCTRCLDVCPSGAIVPAGDHVAVDPGICGGHGACASVCPTAAITYAMPAGDGLLTRLRTLLLTYRQAGGGAPVLLVHDLRTGAEAIGLIARQGRGLPAHVLPFAVNEVGMVGFDLLMTAQALGAAQVRVIAGRGGVSPALRQAVALAEVVAAGLGFGAGRFVVDEVEDPLALEARLYTPPPAVTGEAAEFAVAGGRRAVLPLALRHLHVTAPTPVDVLPLAAGAPFGAVLVDDKCTLCLSCVGACPTRALGDNPERPQLLFTESLCVQCGLCRTTCPENAVTLVPRLNFTAAARERALLREDRPFHCIRCGKAFGNASSVAKMLGMLAGHSMFAGDRLEMLKMCPDCRVSAQFEDKQAPMAGRPRPDPRTTDDYLKARNPKTLQ